MIIENDQSLTHTYQPTSWPNVWNLRQRYMFFFKTQNKTIYSSILSLRNRTSYYAPGPTRNGQEGLSAASIHGFIYKAWSNHLLNIANTIQLAKAIQLAAICNPAGFHMQSRRFPYAIPQVSICNPAGFHMQSRRLANGSSRE